MSRLTMHILKESNKQGILLKQASPYDWYSLLSIVVAKKINTHRQDYVSDKQVFYFSMEFLPGRFLRNNLDNLGWLSEAQLLLKSYDMNDQVVFDSEEDPSLGNGGLGRLASCFLDSIAFKDFSGHGIGLRYTYGLFKQEIRSGHQLELPDIWRRSERYEWETEVAEASYLISFGGNVRSRTENKRLVFDYSNQEHVLAKLYSVPITGFAAKRVNSLYLWAAEATELNAGLTGAQLLEKRKRATEITEFLYPDDTSSEGKQLRLKQQYFLVSAGAQHLVSLAKKRNGIRKFADSCLIHINDTHPSMIIPELMRILMDEEGLGWDDAWGIVTNTVHYTNHTLLTEALEKWPIVLFQPLLPRIYEIIVEINERFCRSIFESHPDLRDQISEMAIISYDDVHMARLAVVGSKKINGVSTLHSHLLKKEALARFAKVDPHKFTSVTNGITHRFWLHRVNPQLSQLITEGIGDGWLKNPEELQQLADFQNDNAFLQRLAQIKLEHKQRLAVYTLEQTGIKTDPHSLFDVHCKRLHGYKRQLLNALHIWHLYTTVREDHKNLAVPRTFLFAAKAAPSYAFAKKVIQYIYAMAQIINNDSTIQGKIKIIFLENYRVRLAEKLIPAAEVSEQISTAGKEASGTGNMKLMMNGALTIGTRDGATVEMAERAGEENMFLFGANAADMKKDYHSAHYYEKDDRIKKMLSPLVDGTFADISTSTSDLYYSLVVDNDEYRLLQDFSSYANAHTQITASYQDPINWQQKSLLNIAASGYFSSDRAIEDYRTQVWNI